MIKDDELFMLKAFDIHFIISFRNFSINVVSFTTFQTKGGEIKEIIFIFVYIKNFRLFTINIAFVIEKLSFK